MILMTMISQRHIMPLIFYLFIFRHARTAPAFSFFFISHEKAKANAKHILEHKVGSFSKK
jgi:hypothetical protein